MSTPAEVMARGMGASKAWPVVFETGSAMTLARAALKALDQAGYAVVPMEADPDAVAEVASAIASEFDLDLADLDNSAFMDFIAAAEAARRTMVEAAREGK